MLGPPGVAPDLLLERSSSPSRTQWLKAIFSSAESWSDPINRSLDPFPFSSLADERIEVWKSPKGPLRERWQYEEDCCHRCIYCLVCSTVDTS